jgi:hypothetical protein
MRLRSTEVQSQGNGAHETEHSNTAEKLSSKRHLKPFGKGFDPRRNLKGRPRTFDQARVLAQAIAHEPSADKRRTVIEDILRQWSKSKEPQLQKAFVEYAFGKVPDKIESTGLENKPTLILHYGHEKEKRDRDHQRLSTELSQSTD